MIILGIIFILHSLVHLLYGGQSGRLFDLRPIMSWPDGSWAFSKILGDETTRLLASISLILAALGFIAGGLGLFIRQDWWQPTAVGTAVFSSAVFLLLWDGKFQALADKGWVGILINVIILFVVLVLMRPSH